MGRLDRALEWFDYAAGDLASAECLEKYMPIIEAHNLQPYMRARWIQNVCFFCQQSTEKYLKGYLVLHGENPTNSHDLDYLRARCERISDEF